MFDKKISNWLYKVYDKVAMREIIMNSVFCKKSIRNLSLRGGGKKRKKKNYTKPKKNKHISAKIKLRVLNYYSIQTGTLLRKKKESPEAPGCYLAEHIDRLTCGKTGLTFMKTV
jgi:ribosomal protein S27AE